MPVKSLKKCFRRSKSYTSDDGEATDVNFKGILREFLIYEEFALYCCCYRRYRIPAWVERSSHRNHLPTDPGNGVGG